MSAWGKKVTWRRRRGMFVLHLIAGPLSAFNDVKSGVRRHFSKKSGDLFSAAAVRDWGNEISIGHPADR
jgi:hypothetical protein